MNDKLWLLGLLVLLIGGVCGLMAAAAFGLIIVVPHYHHYCFLIDNETIGCMLK